MPHSKYKAAQRKRHADRAKAQAKKAMQQNPSHSDYVHGVPPLPPAASLEDKDIWLKVTPSLAQDEVFLSLIRCALLSDARLKAERMILEYWRQHRPHLQDDDMPEIFSAFINAMYRQQHDGYTVPSSILDAVVSFQEVRDRYQAHRRHFITRCGLNRTVT